MKKIHPLRVLLLIVIFLYALVTMSGYLWGAIIVTIGAYLFFKSVE